MPTTKLKYTQPEFLLCEIPIKDGSSNDERIWIYHSISLSLIEFAETSNLAEFESTDRDHCFLYNKEIWVAWYVQNSCDYTGQDENDVLKSTWDFFHKYLQWQDKLIEDSEREDQQSSLN